MCPPWSSTPAPPLCIGLYISCWSYPDMTKDCYAFDSIWLYLQFGSYFWLHVDGVKVKLTISNLSGTYPGLGLGGGLSPPKTGRLGLCFLLFISPPPLPNQKSWLRPCNLCPLDRKYRQSVGTVDGHLRPECDRFLDIWNWLMFQSIQAMIPPACCNNTA